MSNVMPTMEDNRIAYRFTQKSDVTYQTVTNQSLPEWHRELVRMVWFGRIPTSVWNDMYLKLERKAAVGILKGTPTELTDEQIQVACYLVKVAERLIAKGILPCRDHLVVAPAFQMGVDLLKLEYQLSTTA